MFWNLKSASGVLENIPVTQVSGTQRMDVYRGTAVDLHAFTTQVSDRNVYKDVNDKL